MKETFDYRDKMAITRAITDYRRGRISRRTMMKTLAAAGVALSAGPCVERALSPHPLGRR